MQPDPQSAQQPPGGFSVAELWRPPSIGYALAAMRQRAGLTIDETAERLGTVHTTVRRLEVIERGRRGGEIYPIDDVLRIYSQALDRDRSELWAALLEVLEAGR